MTLVLGLKSGILIAFVAGVALVLVAVLVTAGGGNDPSLAAAASPISSPSEVPTALPTPRAPTETPAATPAPVALRTCAEMLASGYFQSEAEKQFYDANCRPTQPAAPPNQAGAAPRPAPTVGRAATSGFAPANAAGMIEYTGGVWPEASIPVPYCVNPANPPVGSNGQPLITPERFAAMVQTAFRRWQDIANARIAFAYQGICDADPWHSGDGVNTIGWGWLFGSAIGLSELNQTNGRFLRQSSTGQLYEVDILIDVRYAQSFDNPADYLDWRLQQILTHEAGHFLGLGHSGQPCSIMAPAIAYVPDLCWVEVAATQTLYP